METFFSQVTIPGIICGAVPAFLLGAIAFRRRK